MAVQSDRNAVIHRACPGSGGSWRRSVMTIARVLSSVWVGQVRLRGGSAAATVKRIRRMGLCLVALCAMGSMVAAPALATSSGAFAWGMDINGQLGAGGKPVVCSVSCPLYPQIEPYDGEPHWNSPVPVPVARLSEVTAVSAGAEHSLALSNGTVTAWGRNERGELGIDPANGPAECIPSQTQCSTVPLALTLPEPVTAISAGGGQNLALLRRGQVMAWGSDGPPSPTPVKVCAPETKPGCPGEAHLGEEAGKEVTAVSSGDGHSLALLNGGKVVAWGTNTFGELGNGTTEASPVPVRVSLLEQATAVSAGVFHSLALLKGGTVMAWGLDTEGQLGNESEKCGGSFGCWETSPLKVCALNTKPGCPGEAHLGEEAGREVTAIAAGAYFSLALLKDGTVVAWGEMIPSSNSRVPVTVTGLPAKAVTAISAGYTHALALSNGKVWAWGSNANGELGNGTEIESPEPVEVSGLTGITGISAGRFHSLAYRAPTPEPQAITFISPAPSNATVGGPTYKVAATGGGSGNPVTFTIDSASKSVCTISGSIVSFVGAGTCTIDANQAGNASYEPAPQAQQSFPVAPRLPTITKLSPTKGPAAGGTQVTITGANMTGATKVMFGSVSATSFKVTTVKTITSITAVSPAEVAKTVDVTVTTPIGTSAISSLDHFKFGPPTVTKLTPNSGSISGGTTVTGTGFGLGTEATLFKFGTTEATTVNCTSNTSCTVTAPSHVAGIVDVKATVSGQISPKALSDQFTYN
jgi:alpha-tubulin suppressor-like RCC1 family protein